MLNKEPTDEQNVLIVAGEASSALYAQRLLEYWKKHEVAVKPFGVGSQSMVNLGFEALGRSEEMAVVGLQEVLAHYSDIKKVFNSLLSECEKRKPKFALLLDYPDFNLRLAKKLKAMGIPVVYYISPQVWAWRTSRVKTIQKVVDQMLVLFPFEVDFYKKHGVPVNFVGHPLLDEISPDLFDQQEINKARLRYGWVPEDQVIGLMPGSRKSEIGHHLEIQMEAASLMHKKHPHLKFALLTAPTLEKSYLQSELPNYKFPLTIVKDEPMKMVSLCDTLLCASGTATLLVGLMEKPMTIMYIMNSLTAWLAKRIVKSTEYFGMVNLVSDKKVVSEMFQEQANPENLVTDMERLTFQDNERSTVVNDLKELKNKLGARGATERVAGCLDEYLRS